jgi:hypothetical protein
MSATQRLFPFARKAWGSRRQQIDLMPAGQTLVCEAKEAKILYATAKRLGRRSQMLRSIEDNSKRLFTIWT